MLYFNLFHPCCFISTPRRVRDTRKGCLPPTPRKIELCLTRAEINDRGTRLRGCIALPLTLSTPPLISHPFRNGYRILPLSILVVYRILHGHHNEIITLYFQLDSFNFNFFFSSILKYLCIIPSILSIEKQQKQLN